MKVVVVPKPKQTVVVSPGDRDMDLLKSLSSEICITVMNKLIAALG